MSLKSWEEKDAPLSYSFDDTTWEVVILMLSWAWISSSGTRRWSSTNI
jgi:hypothetical protein